MENLPRVIIVVSGKRKSGKDFVTGQVVKAIGEQYCQIIRVADSVKKWVCQKYGLDYSKMLTSCEYKERVRKEMIQWDAEQREKEKYIFCNDALRNGQMSCKSVWILSDARRIDDVVFFQMYAADNDILFYYVRVFADENTRKVRNWKYISGIDDVDSECGLDDYKKWDFLFLNSLNDNVFDQVQKFCKIILSKL